MYYLEFRNFKFIRCRKLIADGGQYVSYLVASSYLFLIDKY